MLLWLLLLLFGFSHGFTYVSSYVNYEEYLGLDFGWMLFMLESPRVCDRKRRHTCTHVLHVPPMEN